METYQLIHTGAEVDTAVGRALVGGAIDNAITEVASDVSELDTRIDSAEDSISIVQTNITALQTGKQDNLTAGTNITIVDNVISASGGSGGGASIQTTTNVLKGDGAGNGVAATPGTDYLTITDKPESFTVTLTTSGWENKQQTVSNAKFVADGNGYDFFVAPAPGSVEAYRDGGVYMSAISNGSATFTCTDVLTSELTVNIQKVGVR